MLFQHVDKESCTQDVFSEQRVWRHSFIHVTILRYLLWVSHCVTLGYIELNKTDLLPMGTISPVNEGFHFQDKLHPKILTKLSGKTTEPLKWGGECW